MNFGQRLSRYLIGVSIGMLAVFMMFPDYNWLSWTPQNRVLKEIQDKNVSIDSTLFCKGSQNGIQWNIQGFAENAVVDFDASKTKMNPRVYIIGFDGCEIIVEVGDSAARVSGISGAGKCDCIHIKHD